MGPMAIQRILCPLDLDEETEGRVLDYAVATAQKLDAGVHLLHVYDLPGYVHPPIDSEAAKSYEERALRRSRKKLDQLIADHADVKLSGELHPGIPHRRISEEVSRLQMDLIVMGTHARGGIKRFFLGSVAERVLRTSKVPVLTVPYVDHELPAPPTSILVPHDFSAGSRKALDLARLLHKALHASIAVVHVVPAELSDDGATAYLDAPDRRRYREALEIELARDIDEVFGPEAQVVTTKMVEGSAVESILEVRRELDSDLIVVGASGKSGAERILLGSVTAGLVRASDVPVLTVP